MSKSLRSNTKLSLQSTSRGLLEELPRVTQFQNTKLPLEKEVISLVAYFTDQDDEQLSQQGYNSSRITNTD